MVWLSMGRGGSSAGLWYGSALQVGGGMRAAYLWTLTALMLGCQVDQTKGTEGHCSVTELQRLMEGCVEYGGDYIGESRSVTTVECSAKLSDIESKSIVYCYK